MPLLKVFQHALAAKPVLTYYAFIDGGVGADKYFSLKFILFLVNNDQAKIGFDAMSRSALFSSLDR